MSHGLCQPEVSKRRHAALLENHLFLKIFSVVGQPAGEPDELPTIGDAQNVIDRRENCHNSRRTHFENSMIDALLHKEHTPYREIGQRAVAYTLERAGIAYTMDEVRFLVAQIERLKPFPDVPAALARLNARYRIAVLSNGDPDMLEAARPFHGIAFDAVIPT